MFSEAPINKIASSCAQEDVLVILVDIDKWPSSQSGTGSATSTIKEPASAAGGTFIVRSARDFPFHPNNQVVQS
jgi:hypothetical protein